jgi:hypothetical protein
MATPLATNFDALAACLAHVALAGASLLLACGPASSAGFDSPPDAIAVAPEAGQEAETPAPPAVDDASPTLALSDGGASPPRCQPGTYVLVTNNGTWDANWGLAVGDASIGSPLVTGTATLVGQLDCSNAIFTASAQNSTFTIVGIPSGSFTLTLTGTYDPATEAITGTFAYGSQAGDGSGTWQATLTD